MVQALFANQRESNLASTLALVEGVLGELGHDPAGCRIDSTALHEWRIAKGSAVAHVALVDRTEFTHFRVCAIVMTLDDKVDRAALHAHLLAQNAQLCGVAFATEDDRVILVAERSTLDLDRSEIRNVIARVTTDADDHDDALVAKFGGTRGAVT